MKGKKIDDIKIVHNICLNIAKEMHRILTEHNIPYFMLAGTLLGSVRHHGFIPWDDDMDFGILRANYWNAIEVLKKELPSPYKCISYHDSKICIQESCKIMDMSTRIHEYDDINNEDKGLFIDLFPIDFCNGRTGMFSMYMVAKSFVRFQEFRFTKLYGRNVFLKSISFIIKSVFFLLDYKTVPRIKGKILANGSGNYLIAYDSIYGSKDIFPKELAQNIKLMPFEDTFFWGIDKYDIYLSNLYGDYMTAPPPSERHIHLKEAVLMA